MELPITLPADHPLQLGNFTSAHLGTFESALTKRAKAKQVRRRGSSSVLLVDAGLAASAVLGGADALPETASCFSPPMIWVLAQHRA
jgi:hypothetical protein